jgi:hypothetical protein
MSHLPHLRPSTVEHLRLTLRAREALCRAGNRVIVDSGSLVGQRVTEHSPSIDGTYSVEIISPPPGIVVCLIGISSQAPGWRPEDGEQHRGLRLDDEPPYPGEWPAGTVPWWEIGEWVPCPTCGAALLWCEAGFVPGWRICLSGHASQLSGDGKRAKRHAAQDASTLLATKGI